MLFYTADFVISNVDNTSFNDIIVANNSGEIIELINPSRLDYEIIDLQKFQGIICPGFVNSHCHTELSYLKNIIKQSLGLDLFIRNIEKNKLFDEEVVCNSIAEAEKLMLDNGIVAVADICNNVFSLNNKLSSKLKYYTFIEVFGSDALHYKSIFSEAVNTYLKFVSQCTSDDISIIPHAPYSLSKELFEEIYQFHINNQKIWCIHHQESEEENQYFKNGSGNIRTRLDSFGKNHVQPINSNIRPWQAILPYIPKNTKSVFVHNTYTTELDFNFMNQSLRDVWWCFCPNSNLFIENTLPNIYLFIDNTENIVIGTDSLASNVTLSILDELITLQKHFPSIATETLIKWATKNGADLFNYKELGSFNVGKRPGIVNINNINHSNLQLTKQSTCRRIL